MVNRRSNAGSALVMDKSVWDLDPFAQYRAIPAGKVVPETGVAQLR